MKIGVLTFQWSYNYGTLLQAHGLCQTLTGLGHTVRLINYVPPAVRLRWWEQWGLRHGMRMPVYALRRLRYDEFRRSHLPLTRLCQTTEDLRALSAEFDAVVVGSDQVWSGHIVETTGNPYFLDFVDPQRCRRISYAACFGERGQPRNTLDAAASLLRDFNSISVRNGMSADLVRELSGRDATVVLDPSFLHEYRDVVEPAGKKAPYIAVYFVSPNHIGIGQRVLRAARECLQLPVVTIGSEAMAVCGDTVSLSAGPSEWVQILRDASFICTDSFHGTSFAVKYKKPFISWTGLRPERIASFLQTCGLQSRLIGNAESSDHDALLKSDIDYGPVFERLLPHIQRSRRFLEEALAP